LSLGRVFAVKWLLYPPLEGAGGGKIQCEYN
jgi:hypothetical protein